MPIKSHVANKNWYDNYDKTFGRKAKVKSIEAVDELATANKKASKKKVESVSPNNEPVVESAEPVLVIAEQDSTAFAIIGRPRKRTRRSHETNGDDKKKY